MTPLTPTLTHPERAGIVLAGPLLLTIAAILLVTLLGHTALRRALAALIVRTTLTQQGRSTPIVPALIYTPPIITDAQLLAVALGVAIGSIAILSFIAPLLLAIVLAAPAVAAAIWLSLVIAEQRYVAALNASLVDAIGRLAAKMAAANGFQVALRAVVADMPPGPLQQEWSFLATRIGTSVGVLRVATDTDVVSALLAQTPSPRHATFLGHLEAALGQSGDVQVTRLNHAYAALNAAERQKSTARTEMAEQRNNSIFIGLSSLVLTIYLFVQQGPRALTAYTAYGALSTIMAVLIFSAPIISIAAGILLSRMDDGEY